MNYKSPFHYLSLSTTQGSELNAIEIQRAKKRMLAEFELMGTDAENKASANELLHWFDSLKPEELRYHRVIFENKPLLNFLENGIAEQPDWNAYTVELKNDTSLQNFLFPLIQKKYDFLFAEAFRNRDVTKIKELSLFYLPELDKKGRKYYSSTTQQITNYYHQLKQITSNWEPQQEAKLLEFLQLPFLPFLKELPPYFQAVRDEFVKTLLHLSNELKEEENKYTKLTEQIFIAINSIDPKYQSKKKVRSALTGQKTNKRNGCRWVFFLFFMLFLLAKIIGFVLALI